MLNSWNLRYAFLFVCAFLSLYRFQGSPARFSAVSRRRACIEYQSEKPLSSIFWHFFQKNIRRINASGRCAVWRCKCSDFGRSRRLSSGYHSGFTGEAFCGLLIWSTSFWKSPSPEGSLRPFRQNCARSDHKQDENAGTAARKTCLSRPLYAISGKRPVLQLPPGQRR